MLKKKLKKNARDKAHDKGSRKMQRSRSPTLTRGEIEQERKKPSKCSCDKSREKSSEFSEVGRVNQILFVLIGEEKPSKCSWSKSREKSSKFSEVGRANQILFVLIGEEKPSKCSWSKSREKSSKFSEVGRVDQILFCFDRRGKAKQVTLFVKQEQGEIEQETKSQARLSVLEARAGGNRASFQRRGGSTKFTLFWY